MLKSAQGWKLSRHQKIVLIVSLPLVVLLAILAVSYFSVSNKVQEILPGNLLDTVKTDPLKTTDSRTNILIFGTSYDDPNPSHTGGYLTDSLIVLSIDEHAKAVYTISIPRDLWIHYDMPCSGGKSGKINAVYLCALNASTPKDTDKASRTLADKAGEIVGLPIHYYVQVNYTFIQTLTDALGGIDVDIHTQDSRGIYDPNVGLTVPSGTVHLDGKAALKLARARNAAGGYGLPQSNFDREINQQRIFAAILKKASTSGQLQDINTALKLLDALAGHIRTDVRTSELRSSLTAAKSIDMNKIISIPLTDHMTTGNISGQSVVLPSAGESNYTEIQTHISNSLAQKDAR